MSEPADAGTAQGLEPPPSRRAVLLGAGVTCVAALAGCSTYDANNGGVAGPPPSAPATSAAASSGGGTATGTAPASNALASTAQVPEGGGTIISGKNIVITQPQAGSFKAFTAVCTHQGCIVSSVSGGTINCPCHGSKFSIKDGSVVNGPAASPLSPITIEVEGSSIIQG
ncbi:Rieske (2Fe-2S) protein [Trebonia kvetii]|uniref:Cytochrome bc1 complex Rieske iron-sulfur subunit n=1 Tax=Trebonia kvetii TaxID=2480626 RepID=A0A6P2C2C1_9ACTN|nr:Rieske (2Fe-2S) protein [Trebonia kvetii]TVZ05552.1 Rieske (2Fe-2S) protein [Trebonia kvetii]